MSAILLLCSCTLAESGDSAETTLQSADIKGDNNSELYEFKRALHFSQAGRIGNDMYIHCENSTEYDNGKADKLVLSEYGLEKFEIYMACFDPTCSHSNTAAATCCADCVYYRVMPDFPDFIKQNEDNWYTNKLQSFALCGSDQAPCVILFTGHSLYASYPIENKKTVIADGGHEIILNLSDPMIYDGYVYYYQKYESYGTQWRVPIRGGTPERVFEHDNIILCDIIDDKYYINDQNENTSESGYFVMSFDLAQCEAYPEYWKNNEPFWFDEQYGYVAAGGDIYKFDKNNIQSPPELLFSVKDKFPSATFINSEVFNETVYYIYSDDMHRETYTYGNDMSEKYQVFDTIIFGSYNVVTARDVSIDIKNERIVAVQNLLYADEKYVYLCITDQTAIDKKISTGQNIIIHNKLCRITLEEMKYEYIN